MEDLDRTFRVDFTDDGAEKLTERVTEKLKEFMGDYTDDTLVEYVIVLLRNGRRKDEARNELNVFLGDDTDAFVSWLWDHLSIDLHLYVPQQESYIDELAETKPAVVQDTGRSASPQLDSESERETSVKESKSRRNREWKGLVRDEDEPPPLRSSEIEHFHIEKKNHQKPGRAKRYRSPQPPTQKRSRHDDRLPRKREVSFRPLNDAPRHDAARRLLQFAVRDAVGTTRPSVPKAKPTSKRLRSVVSTSTEDITLDEQPQRIRSAPRLSSAVTTAFKAAAEAAEDVNKVRGSSNVFDRLGHSVDVSGVTTHASEVEQTEDVEYVNFDNMVVEDRYTDYHEQNEYVEDVAGNTVMLDRNTDTAYDSASDNDGYLEASQTATSYEQKDDDSLMVQYSVAKNSNEIPRTRVKDQNSNPIGATTSHKIVNISVNVNTWKPSHYQVPQDTKEPKKIEAVQVSDVGATKPGTQQLMNENKRVLLQERDGAAIPDSQKTPPAPGSYSLDPSEDADSRTIFVSNVHFAATKDTLSRHFNKFGEVLKVLIITDATGQPTGSAYVEFMRKGAAELALSLNGTSFLSRILKVVKKSAAYTESSNVMTWPRAVTRPSPYGASRLARSPFPRGMTGYRGGRLAIKPGARSLQWKRESSTTPTAETTVTTPTTPTARNLTYVRKDATKAEVNVGPV